MKEYFFNLSDSISFIGFLATFKHACKANRIDEGAAKRVLPFLVKSALPSSFDRRTSAVANIAPMAASVQSAESLKQQNKLLWSYSKVVSYLLKQFANDGAISIMVSPSLRYNQPSCMTPMLYTDSMCAKSRNGAKQYLH